MGVTLGGAAGGSGLCRARVRWATGCAGIEGCGTSTLGACGLSMLAEFSPLELVAEPFEVGGHLNFPFIYVGGPSDL